VRKKKIFTIHQVHNRLMPLGRVVRLIGVKESIIRDLARVGLIDSEYSSIRTKWFAVEEFTASSVANFVDKVLQNTRDYPDQEADDGSCWLNLEKTIRPLSIININVVTIFLQLVRGKLRAYYREEQHLRLGSLSFNSNDIQAFIESMKCNNEFIGQKKIEELLGVQRKALEGWVRERLITPVAVYGYELYFDQASIEKFLNENISK
jgi:hypothetical protein